MQSSDERKGKSSQSPLLDNSSHGSESDDESEEPVATKEFQVDLQAGSQQVEGMRRSTRRQATALHVCDSTDPVASFMLETMMTAMEEFSLMFHELADAAKLEDIPIDPYIPEPKSLPAIRQLPLEI